MYALLFSPDINSNFYYAKIDMTSNTIDLTLLKPFSGGNHNIMIQGIFKSPTEAYYIMQT